MDLLELKNRIISSFNGTEDDLKSALELTDCDRSVFPFNKYEYLFFNLIKKGGITYEQYIEIRSEYISKNLNLWIFEISAPRVFGENFAQKYLQEKCSKLEKPSKKLDPNYSGDYDFWLDGITVEVKASRVVDRDSKEPIYIKALGRDTKKNFIMNFQQLKPQCCDVFIWVAVFRDEIALWVMSSSEVKSNCLYSEGQHRGNKGNEGQLHITHRNIDTLSRYELKDGNLENAIRKAAERK